MAFLESVDTTSLAYMINKTGGIPLVVKMTAETAPYQFYISLGIMIIGSLFTFMLMFTFAKPAISQATVQFTLAKIKKLTGRGILVIKHTTSGFLSQNMITTETIRQVIKKISEFKGKPFDLILYTPGGEIFSSMYISRILKQYPAEIRAVVPIYSMSGGTLLALSCNKIFMNPNACLGPVDPQLGSLFSFGSAKVWSDLIKFKKKKVDDMSFNMAKIGEQYTDSIKNAIIELVHDKVPAKKLIPFVNLLTAGNIEHAFPITPQVLDSFGYDVNIIDDKLQDALSDIATSTMYEGVYASK